MSTDDEFDDYPCEGAAVQDLAEPRKELPSGTVLIAAKYPCGLRSVPLKSGFWVDELDEPPPRNFAEFEAMVLRRIAQVNGIPLWKLLAKG